MKIDVVEIQKGDVMLIKLDIGSTPPNEVDNYVKKTLKPLKETFGTKISVLPVRGEGWDFTIIRKVK